MQWSTMSVNLSKHKEWREQNMMLQSISSALLVQKTILTNHILSTFEESEHEIENFCDSRDSELSDITSIIKEDEKDFTILTLNIQSINAKFDNLYPVINNLSSMGLYFGAICLQETWLSSDADVSLLHIPGYKLIHQGSRCTRHGGLVIYLHEQYIYISYEICTRGLTSGKAYLLMSQATIFTGLLQSATFTDHLTITIIMPISKHLSRKCHP